MAENQPYLKHDSDIDNTFKKILYSSFPSCFFGFYDRHQFDFAFIHGGCIESHVGTYINITTVIVDWYDSAHRAPHWKLSDVFPENKTI